MCSRSMLGITLMKYVARFSFMTFFVDNSFQAGGVPEVSMATAWFYADSVILFSRWTRESSILLNHPTQVEWDLTRRGHMSGFEGGVLVWSSPIHHYCRLIITEINLNTFAYFFIRGENSQTTLKGEVYLQQILIFWSCRLTYTK